MKSRGGICRDSPLREMSGRGVTGWCRLIVLSSLDVRREASTMCGEGDSLEGVPPLSDKERVLVKGDRAARVLDMASAPAWASSPVLTSSMMADSSNWLPTSPCGRCILSVPQPRQRGADRGEELGGRIAG